jgi:hypothetical protein
MNRRDLLKILGLGLLVRPTRASVKAESAKEPNSTNVAHVNWCARPPVGVGFQTHKFSFVDAPDYVCRIIHEESIHRGLDYGRTTIYCGANSAMLLWTIPSFKPGLGGKRTLGTLRSTCNAEHYLVLRDLDQGPNGTLVKNENGLWGSIFMLETEHVFNAAPHIVFYEHCS